MAAEQIRSEVRCISHADDYSCFYGNDFTGSEFYSVAGFLVYDKISCSVQQNIYLLSYY